MKQIVVVKHNSMSEEDRKRLRDEGVILIEHENPSEVRVIHQLEGLEGDDLFNSLIEVVGTSNAMVKSTFTETLIKKILARQNKK